jgi:hypothetical protein
MDADKILRESELMFSGIFYLENVLFIRSRYLVWQDAQMVPVLQLTLNLSFLPWHCS